MPAMEEKIGHAAMRAFQPILAECEELGLLQRTGPQICLTQQGRLFANDVFARFLGVLATSDKFEASFQKAEFQQQGAFV